MNGSVLKDDIQTCSTWPELTALFLRGLTFDGEKGLFVNYHEGKAPDKTNSGAVNLHISAKGKSAQNEDDIEAFLGELKNMVDAHMLEYDQYPERLALTDASGDCWFSLADSFDTAESDAGADKRPSKHKPISRDDVVRGKIAVVTGGAQGFGEGMVHGLVENGCFVFIADMNLKGAEKLAETVNLEKGYTAAKALEVNVTDEASVAAMMKQIALKAGGIDVFISNAGVLRAGSVKEMTLKDFSFVTSVDYTGFFICTKHASRLMSRQNQPGRNYMTDIVAISSKSGLVGSNKNGAYAGAKFGTLGLTQSFAMELVEDNIKVNAICPGNFLDGPLWSDPEKGLFVQYLRAGKVPGAESVADVRRAYESKVPLNRGCTTADVMKALLYIVEQKYETGQAVPVTGGQVMLN